MELFVVRHAIAEPRGAGWVDADRPLTPRGIERLEATLKGLRAARVRVDTIVHSPWTRARETAERMDAILSPEGTIIEDEGLAAPPDRGLLVRLAAHRSVAVVGHEPWLGELVAWLVAGDLHLGERFALKKAGVAWLSGDPAPLGCVLRASWTPRMLRLAGD